LVDAPLAALIWMLALVLPQASAEYVVCFAMPLLVLLATMIFVGSLARERFGGRIALLAVAAFVLMPMVPGQFQPLRIDHHSWQVLSVGIAMWGIFRRDPARGALVAGLAMAAGLMISLETIVLAAGFAIVLVLRWLEDPRQSVWLARYLQVLAGGLAGLFALTRGATDLAPHCDVIAPAHMGFFAIVAAGTSVLAARARLGTGTLHLVNGSQNHMQLSDAANSNRWSLNIDGSGNLRVLRAAGSGTGKAARPA
jgi:hypothetical protein